MARTRRATDRSAFFFFAASRAAALRLRMCAFNAASAARSIARAARICFCNDSSCRFTKSRSSRSQSDTRHPAAVAFLQGVSAVFRARRNSRRCCARRSYMRSISMNRRRLTYSARLARMNAITATRGISKCEATTSQDAPQTRYSAALSSILSRSARDNERTATSISGTCNTRGGENLPLTIRRSTPGRVYKIWKFFFKLCSSSKQSFVTCVPRQSLGMRAFIHLTLVHLQLGRSNGSTLPPLCLPPATYSRKSRPTSRYTGLPDNTAR